VLPAQSPKNKTPKCVILWAMKTVLRFFFKILSVVAATLAGNWVGAQMRTSLTGETAQSIRSEYTDPGGRTFKNVPVVTKFYPGLLASWLGKPRWVFAFLGGLLTGALVDDRYERMWWRWVNERFFPPS